MTSNASAQFHMRFVTEKHNELIASLDQLTTSLVTENIENKKTKAGDTYKKTTDLKSSISNQDCPAWLDPLMQCLQNFISGPWKPAHVINHIITNIGTIRNYKWVFDDPDKAAFDF